MKELIDDFYEYCKKKKVLRANTEKEPLISDFIMSRYRKINELPARIAMIVSVETGVSLDSMYQKTRLREIVESRQIAMFLIRAHTKLTFRETGMVFSTLRHAFDHSTVIYSVQTVLNMKDSDRNFREKVNYINNKVLETIEPKADES